MENVRMLLQHKGSAVWSTSPDALVIEALRLMAEKNVGALVVLHDGELVGIFSERDYARKGELAGKAGSQARVQELMVTPVFCVEPQTTIEECMAVMTGKHIRHLPVLEAGRCVGVISIGDVVKGIISRQEFLIEQLEKYVTVPYQPLPVLEKQPGSRAEG